MSFQTIEHHFGKTLDLREYEFKHRDGIYRAIYDISRRYATFAPHRIPDIVILTEQQRAMLPKGNFIRSPYSILEIQTKMR